MNSDNVFLCTCPLVHRSNINNNPQTAKLFKSFLLVGVKVELHEKTIVINEPFSWYGLPAEDELVLVSRTEELQLVLVGLIVKVLIVVGLIQKRRCVCVKWGFPTILVFLVPCVPLLCSIGSMFLVLVCWFVSSFIGFVHIVSSVCPFGNIRRQLN